MRWKNTVEKDIWTGATLNLGWFSTVNDEKNGAHGSSDCIAVKLRTKESGNSQRVEASAVNGNLLLKLLQINYNIIFIFTPSR